MSYHVGVDIGGTFTDLIAVEPETGKRLIVKTPTTPDDFSRGFVDALRAADIMPDEIADYLVHGTTLGTNATVERRGPRLGLLCTAGFRDVIETRRWWKPHLFDNSWRRPAALVPRHRRLEVTERLDWQGEVVTPLDVESVRTAVRTLRDDGVESYAVSLLFSYLNADHEHRVAELIREEHPDAYVSLSSEVLPEIREYERTSTTVINAFLQPLFARYLSTLQTELDGMSIESRLWILKSNCGIMTPARAIARAVDTIESGPAGGVTAAAEFGRRWDAPHLIAFDMGGTTTDVSLIEDYAPVYKMEHDVEWNIPVRTLMADIQSIGAGGGSIAWVDPGGALQVGPQSAGAVPGPACYGGGGTRPTVTDAELVLGRLNADYFLGGEVSVEPERSVEALERDVGQPFGWQVESAAAGVHQIALGNMVRLIREVTINRGRDPRDFALICFGGAGGLFAAELAAELGVPEVFVPRDAGVFSALGGTIADVMENYVHTYLVPVEDRDPVRFEELFVELEERARKDMREDQGIDDPELQRSVDLRYIGEAYEITVPLGENGANGAALSPDGMDEAIAAYHRMHDRAYGFHRPQEPVEIVAVRLQAVHRRGRPDGGAGASGSGVGYARTGSRRCWFAGDHGFVDVPVYRREGTESLDDTAGPLVVETPETTVVVGPGDAIRSDGDGNMRIRIGA
jgi:N-methylhydantoinase A/oxoprolinase/acetone carboxylase beta subunit